MLLESTDPARLDSLLETIVTQTAVRKEHRVLGLKRFKSAEGERIKFRDFFVPSPTSAIADAYALDLLHRTGALIRRPDVFSYRPPPAADYGRSFEHFADGYRERNEAISAAMIERDSVAVVADIENFYPSVDGELAIRKLMSLVANCGASVESRQVAVIESAARRALSKDSGGLRIGLELSHALASVYLHELDVAMRTRFPGRYFRYVDDVVVVTSASDRDEVLAVLDAQLESLGLKRNANKDSVASASEWRGYLDATRRSTGAGYDPLAALKFRLKLFLARNPGRLAELEASLRSRDVYLPISQLLHSGRDVTWRSRVAEFVNNGWRVLFKYRFDNVEDLAHASTLCRAEVLGLLRATVEKGVSAESGTVARRWQVQGARFAINRALYFADSKDLALIAAFASGVDELAEARAVCEALTGNLGRLALTPGPAVAAGAQLLSIRGVGVPDNISAASLFASPEVSADFETHLSLRGLATPVLMSQDWTEDLRGLISLAKGERLRRTDRTIRYGTEVASLSANFSIERARAMARTRFLPQESVVLDALSLDSAYGS